jgi:GH35 family endo-1,4-beta-xylanase
MRAYVSALILSPVSTFALLGASQTLREAADHNGLLVSAAVRPAQLSEPACASTLAREFNIVEAEGAMKWWVLQPDEATYDFRQGDEKNSLRSSPRYEIPRALSRLGTL